MKYFVWVFLLMSSLSADQFFIDRNGDPIRFAVVKSVDEIDERGREILVASFMSAYEDVPLLELNPSFRSIGDVRRFYEHYFDSEREHYKKGELVWVQAFSGDELVGWATFQLEPNDEVYMNLLSVDPAHQKKGIGRHLVFSICSEELYPNTRAINVLIRKVNAQGSDFYQTIGFLPYPDYQAQDNYVDNALLTPIRWEKDR